MAITQITVASPSAEVIFTDTAMGGTADGIKSSSALVYNVQVDNSLNGAASYVKLYNVASGSVTVGTTVPDMVLLVPANKVETYIFSTSASPGLTFGTALSAACTTAGGTSGNTSPSSSVIVSVTYV
jgi:hypothetical protein